MTTIQTTAGSKFDAARAGDYAVQSRIALAGYEACHKLTACVLAAALGPGADADILVAGAGGNGQEMVVGGRLEPRWRFTAVDPSPPMLRMAESRVAEAGLSDRTIWRQGTVGDLPAAPTFDAATLIGVLHHLPGREPKREILDHLAARLRPGAPLVLACNRHAYASRPLLLAAWGERWRMNGASPAEVEARLGTILQGADPPGSEAEVAALLAEAGFEPPTLFFSSLFWGAWVSRRWR